MSTLSDRLRERHYRTQLDFRTLCAESADELDRLTARVAELERLLKPFAEVDLKREDVPANFAWFVLNARAALEHKHDCPPTNCRDDDPLRND